MSNEPRTVVITGASSGIGLALAQACIARGYNVVGNGRSADRLNAAAQTIRKPENFVGISGDIALADTSKRLFDAALEKFGRVDVLVNNAGVFVAKPITRYTSDDLDSLIDTNLKGFFYPTQIAAEHMIANGGGHIVNITAAVGIQPNAKVPSVLPTMVKGGLNQATKALAIELAPHNIKVNAVAPGVIDTPLHNPEKHAFLATLNPFGRVGDSAQIVAAVLYLMDSDFTTGVILPVDGGASAGR
jgi:NAD(P)-dependent dehydrogenase (short-subunit alcohol dehydrogenase family)